MPKIVLNILFLIVVSMLFAQSDGDKSSRIQGNESTIKNVSRKSTFYPNPTYGIVNFDLSLYNYSGYRIVIKNIIAKEIWSKNVNDQRFREDFGFLDKGTYLLSIENINGRKLFTKRLIIITP